MEQVSNSFLCSYSIIIVDACRKLDYNRDPNKSIAVNKTEKFFTVPASTDPRVKAIANKIKRQDDSAHFVNTLVEKIGYPVWNKALIASPPMAHGRNQTDSSSMNYLYIPFDNDSTIDATLIVRTDPDDTLFRLLNDREYSYAGFDTTNGELWNARNIFHLFAYFEKEVFGHNTLMILDRRLFPQGDTTRPIRATLRASSSNRSSRASLLELITMCDLIDVCYTDPGTYQSVCDSHCSTDCPYWTHVESDCFTFWVSGGGGWSGGSPPYIPWGGGGGSPWYQNTCTGNAQCGSPGWVVTGESLFLTDYTTQGYHHFEYPAIIRVDKDAINDWKAENIDTTGLDPCIREVLNKLLDTSNLIGKMLVKMDRAMFRTPNIKKLFLTIKVMSFPQDSTNSGWTTSGYYDQATQTLVDTIKIKPSIAAGASELGIAMLLMHEIMHAYLKLSFYIYWYTTFSQSAINNWSVDTLFNIYTDSMVAQHTYQGLQNWMSGDPQRDHNFMADKMISAFASILEKIDGSNIPNKRYYWFLPWGGLWYTKTMKHFWPNSPVWPPTSGYPATNEDSTYGLRYAFTEARLDSIVKACYREEVDTAHALGKKRGGSGCYQNNSVE